MRHADEARRAYERAVRSTLARFEAAEQKPTAAARTIARRAVAFELEALCDLEGRLQAIEERIAVSIEAQNDPRDYRRLRLAD